MGSPRRPSSDAISQFDECASTVFDQWSMGMVRVSPDLKIAAWNRMAAEIMGLTTLEGRSAEELLADRQSIEALRSQWEQRRQGRITELEINVFHFPDRRPVPVHLSVMPMISDTGEFAGTFSVLRSLEVERRVGAFEEAIHTAERATTIFKDVCNHIRPLLNFDFAAFSIYSKNGQHSRMLLSYDPEGQVASHKRWYPMCGKLAEWSQKHHEQVVEDYADFVRQFPELDDDPTAQQFLRAGFVKFVRFPVVRGGRVVASFSCFSRERTAFGKHEMRIVKGLPIAKAFLMALHSLENDELLFRVNLIREMFICSTQKEIADVSARKIAEQYGWKSVEIYTIEEASRQIRLLSQSASSDYAVEEGYAQSMDKGILGYVCNTDQDVRIDNVNSDPQFKDVFVRLRRGTVSELCMPIRVNGRISALLNVEDKHENAFALEEQEKLRSLLDEIGGLFGAVWNKALMASAFEVTPSLVLIADLSRTVIQHNAATVSRLGFAPEELLGSPVNTYFEPEIADRLFQAPPLTGIETEMRRKDGTTLPVLLGAQELEGFGAWVISARDLTAQKRIAELENLRHMYREIAAQTKTPLSLAYSWIQRLERQARDSQSDSAATLHKVLAQLKKVDMTYERLALYSQETANTTCMGLLLNAGDLLKRTASEFPDGLLSVQGTDGENFYVRGDPYEIDFAVESMISYLQRFLPADERILVRLTSVGQRLLIEIQGPHPPEPRCGDGERSDDVVPEAVCRAIHEMSLGAEIIGKLMQRHGGEFRQEALPENRVRFQLVFPLQHVVV
jgi:PAS domain S-box-containing protein